MLIQSLRTSYLKTCCNVDELQRGCIATHEFETVGMLWFCCLQKQEMSAVKAERARLIEQLTLVKTDPGKAGGDLQQEDIMNLRREVEVKKAKLNELHEVSSF